MSITLDSLLRGPLLFLLPSSSTARHLWPVGGLPPHRQMNARHTPATPCVRSRGSAPSTPLVHSQFVSQPT